MAQKRRTTRTLRAARAKPTEPDIQLAQKKLTRPELAGPRKTSRKELDARRKSTRKDLSAQARRPTQDAPVRSKAPKPAKRPSKAGVARAVVDEVTADLSKDRRRER